MFKRFRFAVIAGSSSPDASDDVAAVRNVFSSAPFATPFPSCRRYSVKLP